MDSDIACFIHQVATVIRSLVLSGDKKIQMKVY